MANIVTQSSHRLHFCGNRWDVRYRIISKTVHTSEFIGITWPEIVYACWRQLIVSHHYFKMVFGNVEYIHIELHKMVFICFHI